MTPRPYNFKRSPRLPPDVQQRSERWLNTACALLTGRAAGQFPVPLEFALQALDTVVCRDALAAAADSAVGYPLQGPRPEWRGMLVWPRPLLLALLGGLTGELPAELPAERDLTAVEASLAEYLVRDLFLAALRETWPGEQAPAVQAGAHDLGVKWSRLFPADKVLAEAVLAVRGPFGEQVCRCLLMPEALPGAPSPAAPPPRPPDGAELRGRLEAVVRTAPVEVTVTLGKAEVPLAQIDDLKPGDVIVLGQRVSDPLVLTVAGWEKFLAWPGRVRARQACQIASPLDR